MMRIGMIEMAIVLGLLFLGLCVLGAIVAAVVVLSTRGGRVACPYCGERIRAEAKVCRYCGRDLTPARPTAEPERNDSGGEL